MLMVMLFTVAVGATQLKVTLPSGIAICLLMGVALVMVISSITVPKLFFT